MLFLFSESYLQILVINVIIFIVIIYFQTPVAHFWAESGHHSQKRRFCNVCRKRLDDTYSFRCEGTILIGS